MADTDPAATLHALAESFRNSALLAGPALAEHVEGEAKRLERARNLDPLSLPASARELLAVAAAAGSHHEPVGFASHAQTSPRTRPPPYRGAMTDERIEKLARAVFTDAKPAGDGWPYYSGLASVVLAAIDADPETYGYRKDDSAPHCAICHKPYVYDRAQMAWLHVAGPDCVPLT